MTIPMRQTGNESVFPKKHPARFAELMDYDSIVRKFSRRVTPNGSDTQGPSRMSRSFLQSAQGG